MKKKKKKKRKSEKKSSYLIEFYSPNLSFDDQKTKEKSKSGDDHGLIWFFILFLPVVVITITNNKKYEI
jgi:hypothetical protein